MRVLWVCVATWLAGCEIPPEVKAQIACETVCTCLAPGGLVEECIQECVEDGDLGQVPDDCFECIQTHANQCSTLEADCEPICEMEPPPPGPDAGGVPPLGPDGGM
jgi:hypothetical protein